MTGLPDDVAELLAVLDVPPQGADPTAEHAEALVEELRGLMAALDDGTMTAPAAVQRRVEGAVTGLRMALGAPADDLLDRFRHPPDGLVARAIR